MHTVRVTRFRVKHDATRQFESRAVEQARRLHKSAARVIAYAFLRRGADNPRWPALISLPLPGTVDYMQIAVALDSDGAVQLSSGEVEWKQQLSRGLAMAPEVEEIESPSYVAGVSRDHVWGPGSIFRATIYRMRAKPNEALLEEGALRMMRRVVDKESDSPLYTIARRHEGGSPLLPANTRGEADYIRFHVYRQAEGLELHNELDREWWADFYHDRISAALDGFQVGGSDVLAGFSRDHLWGAATTSDKP